MLRVLQHYLPVRTALLFFSEMLILTAILAIGMSQHLWEPMAGIRGENYRSILIALSEARLPIDLGLWYCVLSSLFFAIISQVAIGFNNLYEFQVSSSRYERAARFVESAGAALALCVGAVVLAHVFELTRVFPALALSQKVQTLVAALVTAFGVLYIYRILFHWFMRRVNMNIRVLVLGSRGPAHALATQVLEHPEAGYEVIGMIPEPDTGMDQRGARAPGAPQEDKIGPVSAPDHEATDRTRALVMEDVHALEIDIENKGAAMGVQTGSNGKRSLMAVVHEYGVDLLVVALEDRRQMLPIRDLLQCRLAGIDVREREEIFEQITGKIAVAAMRPSYLIFNEGFRRHPWAALMKRTVDIVFALVILFFMWPFMLLTALAVRFESPGPILFKQERVGQDGKPFTMRKFRSMRADAEKETGPVWSSEDDPRITRFGRIMRKTRLDELPQLFNVLGGSMSLVGPRPERDHFVQELAARIPYFQQRHIVKPGLTGWAQINYPYGNTVEDALHKLQYDLFYIKNYSVLFDLSILFSTIKTVVLRRGT
ncbi:MAG: TIGR03013 family PEP-CTERM/XrtA system glycosyltransferase [bacterium]|nr:TIGR03013 family PEP-CTERM/XrtA system glycosyltransferase [bacterium]